MLLIIRLHPYTCIPESNLFCFYHHELCVVFITVLDVGNEDLQPVELCRRSAGDGGRALVVKGAHSLSRCRCGGKGNDSVFGMVIKEFLALLQCLVL